MHARRDSWGSSPQRGLTLTLTVSIASIAACSSNASGPPPLPGSEAGASSSGGADGGAPYTNNYPTNGVAVGPTGNEAPSTNVMPPVTSGTCPAQTGTVTVGTFITVPVAWMSAAGTNSGTGNVYTWDIATFTVNGTQTTGTTVTCANTTPPYVLNAVGAMAEGVPMGATGQVVPLVPVATWAKTGMPKFQTTGTLEGWAVGSKVTVDAAMDVIGLSPSSMFAQASTSWPGTKGYMVPMADITDPDGDGKPGVTAAFDTAMGYYPALSGVGGSAVDEVYFVSRTSYALSGTIQPGCVDLTGTVTAMAQDSATVGCHLAPGGDSGSGDCTSMGATSQAAYVSSGNAIYTFPTQGTFHQKLLKTGATCDDVFSALPP
jgi:hypothetical protein